MNKLDNGGQVQWGGFFQLEKFFLAGRVKSVRRRGEGLDLGSKRGY